jgi:hypothetical protein
MQSTMLFFFSDRGVPLDEGRSYASSDLRESPRDFQRRSGPRSPLSWFLVIDKR